MSDDQDNTDSEENSTPEKTIDVAVMFEDDSLNECVVFIQRNKHDMRSWWPAVVNRNRDLPGSYTVTYLELPEDDQTASHIIYYNSRILPFELFDHIGNDSNAAPRSEDYEAFRRGVIKGDTARYMASGSDPVLALVSVCKLLADLVVGECPPAWRKAIGRSSDDMSVAAAVARPIPGGSSVPLVAPVITITEAEPTARERRARFGKYTLDQKKKLRHKSIKFELKPEIELPSESAARKRKLFADRRDQEIELGPDEPIPSGRRKSSTDSHTSIDSIVTRIGNLDTKSASTSIDDAEIASTSTDNTKIASTSTDDANTVDANRSADDLIAGPASTSASMANTTDTTEKPIAGRSAVILEKPVITLTKARNSEDNDDFFEHDILSLIGPDPERVQPDFVLSNEPAEKRRRDFAASRTKGQRVDREPGETFEHTPATVLSPKSRSSSPRKEATPGTSETAAKTPPKSPKRRRSYSSSCVCSTKSADSDAYEPASGTATRSSPKARSTSPRKEATPGTSETAAKIPPKSPKRKRSLSSSCVGAAESSDSDAYEPASETATKSSPKARSTSQRMEATPGTSETAAKKSPKRLKKRYSFTRLCKPTTQSPDSDVYEPVSGTGTKSSPKSRSASPRKEATSGSSKMADTTTQKSPLKECKLLSGCFTHGSTDSESYEQKVEIVILQASSMTSKSPSVSSISPASEVTIGSSQTASTMTPKFPSSRSISSALDVTFGSSETVMSLKDCEFSSSGSFGSESSGVPTETASHFQTEVEVHQSDAPAEIAPSFQTVAEALQSDASTEKANKASDQEMSIDVVEGVERERSLTEEEDSNATLERASGADDHEMGSPTAMTPSFGTVAEALQSDASTEKANEASDQEMGIDVVDGAVRERSSAEEEDSNATLESASEPGDYEMGSDVVDSPVKRKTEDGDGSV